MAFTQSTFAPVGGRGSDVPNVWTYKTNDSSAAVQASGYFIDKEFEMGLGDFVWVFSSDGGFIIQYRGPVAPPVQIAPTSGGSGPTTAIEVTYSNVTSGLAGDNVQLALDEIVVNIGALTAADIAFDDTALTFVATDVQAAIAALDAKVPTGIAAADVSFNNALSGLAATNVQTALTELALSITNLAAIEVSFDNTLTGLTATNVQDALDQIHFNSVAVVDAVDVEFDNFTSGLTATDVQAAIDELDAFHDNLTAVEVAFDNVASGLTATETQGALDELDTAIDTINTDIGALTAADIAFDNVTSAMLATDCQLALDELDARLDALAALEVSYDGTTSGLVAVTVQAAIDELQGLSGGTSTIEEDVFSGDGVTVNFALTSAALTETRIWPFVGGVMQPTSKYSFVGSTLTFTDPPPVGTDNVFVRNVINAP